MGARGRVNTNQRRPARDAGYRSVGGGGGGGPAQLPALPATAVAAWHSEITCSAASWTDYIGGLVLPGVNTPTVATDGAFFSGKVVGQSAVTGAKCWRGTGLAGMPVAGTRPWMFLVGRIRDLAIAGGAETMAGFGANGLDQTAVVGATAAVYFSQSSGGANLLGSAIDTSVHRFKAWKDGINKNFQIDAAAFTVADAGTVPATDTVCIGALPSGMTFPGDASLAYLLICSAKPTAPEEAALDAWAQAYFGAP